MSSEIVDRHREFLFPAVATYYQEPLALVRGEGAYVWDDAGQPYLDAFGGVLTISVGHGNPRVVEAIVEQVKNLSQYRPFMPMALNLCWLSEWRKFHLAN